MEFLELKEEQKKALMAFLDGEDGCASLTTDVGKSLNTPVHFNNKKSDWSSFIMIDRSFFQSPSTFF